MQFAGFHFQRGHANDIALGVADEVKRHPFHKKVRARLDVLLIERVQHRVASAVCCGASPLHGLFTVVGGVSAERTLVNRAVRIAVKRHAQVFELVHHLGRFATHELDRVLVAEPV